VLVGSKIKLVTFNGSVSSPNSCDPAENYWALIGQSGTVVELENSGGRVLVQFDQNVSDMGLHCHNQVSNSLRISVSDIVLIECA
jgi:hypothetical protein